MSDAAEAYPKEGMPEAYEQPTVASAAAIGANMDDVTLAEAATEGPRGRREMDPALRRDLEELVGRWGRSNGAEIDRFVLEMLSTVLGLSKDEPRSLDVKIMSAAMKELRYANRVFKPYQDRKKITIFGSARTPEDRADYLAAVEFARRISELGWMVITGAGDGIMKAGHEGAGKDQSFGVSIRLPFETNANDVIDGDPKLVNFRYFFTRKLMFLKEAEAIALFPGGFGTHDELFEALTLVQTGKNQPVPIVLVDEPGGTYWTDWEAYVRKEFLGNGLISPEDFALFLITDRIDDAVAEVQQFYRRYRSSRYVRSQYVIRMSSPLPEAGLAQIRERFGVLCKSGTFTQTQGPLADEHGEEPEAWRLVFHFHRRDYGRLRLLINAINAA